MLEQGFEKACANSCTYVLLGLNPNMTRTIGFLDESHHPGFFEDEDHRDRVDKYSELYFAKFPMNFIHNGSPPKFGRGGGIVVHFYSEQAEFWKTCYTNNKSYYQGTKSQIDEISLWFWGFDIDRRAEQKSIFDLLFCMSICFDFEPKMIHLAKNNSSLHL